MKKSEFNELIKLADEKLRTSNMLINNDRIKKHTMGKLQH